MVDEDKVTVWVDGYTKVLVTLNGLTVQDVEGAHWLEQPDGRLAFQRGLTEEEKSPGLKKYRAFAVLKDFCMFIILHGYSLSLSFKPKMYKSLIKMHSIKLRIIMKF